MLFIIIAISFCFSSFTAIKQSIPYIVPFYLDDLLIKLDYLMHFNSHPWELTHYLFSGQVWSMVINFLYNVWFLILWFFLVTILISVSKPQRPTIIISFLLCWFINGNILAILLSSVGPVFYGNLVDGSTPYSELMTMLYQQHELLIESDAYITLWALTTQEALWATHLAAENNIGAGISAMPSMHVSIAVMMALACSSLNKKLGVVMWLFAGMIMIGSVHLAWHYALDGYVSFITTTLIWKTVGYFCRKPSLQQDRRFIPVSQ
ncbi:phosphatase PAP2 family protein [Vibrio sp. 10N.286.49.B3]|uniref:phosphatase PAP2 family protein n=1 Tax=Vibrio sp. 10N.286.49.B3 TaxID=1880855 RepID=UPI001055BF67|nr:phosphatase PAP2 family protein [Vibrio sp. 10N.286.49.B3]